MSKLYNSYLKKKEEDSSKCYLFKSGNFYLFLGDDAKLMSDELGLKLTSFSKETQKCGFPVSSLNKYEKFIKLLGIDYEIMKDEVTLLKELFQRDDFDSLSKKELLDLVNETKIRIEGI